MSKQNKILRNLSITIAIICLFGIAYLGGYNDDLRDFQEVEYSDKPFCKGIDKNGRVSWKVYVPQSQKVKWPSLEEILPQLEEADRRFELEKNKVNSDLPEDLSSLNVNLHKIENVPPYIQKILEGLPKN